MHMKLLGLIGGISWVSTIDYYRYINQAVNKRLGGNDFADCIIYSLNYGEVIRHNEAKDFEGTFNIILKACAHLKNSGAEAIVLCANTVHMFADELEEKIGLPVIHVAIATATEINKKGLKRVALLGTKLTMELDFFKLKLRAQNIEPIIPNEEDQVYIHQKIYGELGKGIIKQETKSGFIAIIQKLVAEGSEGIILGCTEIPLLIKQEDVNVPVFDTTLIHSEAAVAFAFD